jgi:hypothetical protein
LIRYRIDDSAWINYTTPFNLSGYAPGNYLISYYSIDLVGNDEEINSRIVVLVEIPSNGGSSAIPGYSIFYLISIIGAITFIHIKRNLKQKNSSI